MRKVMMLMLLVLFCISYITLVKFVKLVKYSSILHAAGFLIPVNTDYHSVE